jgi:3-methyl-2-oxobutanoate hydroxymethyltransferase
MDLILIGDSLAIVALGRDSTNYMTLDEMVYHCKAVARGAKSPLPLGDMPMGTYEVSDEQGEERACGLQCDLLDPHVDDAAAANALKLIKEGRCDAIRLEGSSHNRIMDAGVPVILADAAARHLWGECLRCDRVKGQKRL